MRPFGILTETDGKTASEGAAAVQDPLESGAHQLSTCWMAVAESVKFAALAFGLIASPAYVH